MKTLKAVMEPNKTYHAKVEGKTDFEVTLLVNESYQAIIRAGGLVQVSKGFGIHPPVIVLDCPEGKTPEDFFGKDVASLFSLHE
jgi:hypothetical protein